MKFTSPGSLTDTDSVATAAARSLPLRGGLFLACLLFARTVAAQDVEANTTPTNKAAIGVGFGTRNRPYADLDRDTRVLPLLSYENSWVRLGGLGAELKLANAGPVGFGVRIQYMQDGYKTSDSPVLAGMADRKAGIWLGPSAAWRSEWGNLSISALGDVSGNSKGFQTSVSANKTYHLGKLALTPHASVTWLDAKYVNYYYGVEESEATATRFAYTPGSTVNVSLGLRTALLATQHQTLFLDVSGTRLGDAIRNSPLVDRSGLVGYQVGYLYRFR